MKLKDLKPNGKNPRKISDSALEKLKQSIERDPEFMVLRPIVIDNDGLILGGNQRYRAIKSLGMKDIPDNWVVNAENLTEEQRKRFILVDNAPDGMSGEWDWETLKDSFPEFELADLGFTFEPVEFEETEKDEVQAPDDFKEYDENIETESECPKCGYKWSGGK